MRGYQKISKLLTVIGLFIAQSRISRFNLINSYQLGTEACVEKRFTCSFLTLLNGLRYCDDTDYPEYCSSSDYYYYSREFCNLVIGISCGQKNRNIKTITYLIQSLSHLSSYNISIKYKNLKTLPNNSFVDLRIPYLDLSNNLIEQVEDNAFHRIIGLKELRLNINKVKVINLDLLLDLEVLNLERNRLSSINETWLSHLSKLQILNLDSNSIEFLGRKVFIHNPELRRLYLKTNLIHNFSPFMGHLSKLIYLGLDENKIKELTNSTLFGLHSLKILKLRKNFIQTIEDVTFRDLQQLVRLSIGNNDIDDFNSLGKMKNLMHFSGVRNSIRKIEPGFFHGLSSIKRISLYENPLETIVDYSFANLTTLSKLDLSNCNFKQLGNKNTFAGMASITELDLSNNTLTILEESVFIHLKTLTSLKLSWNWIFKLEANAFKGLENVELLDLSSNNLVRLQNYTLKNLNKLYSLDLCYNFLTVIEPNAFFGLENTLMILNLNSNYLEFIKSYHFKRLHELYYLYLRDNKISSIQVDSFRQLKQLNYLDLSNNCLFHVEPDLFLNLFYLRTLIISENLIRSVSAKTFANVRSLDELNLGYNLLTTINYRLFSNFLSLKKLNLEFNQLTSIDFEAFHNLETLIYLNIGDEFHSVTSIKPIEGGQLKLFPRLRSIYFNNDSLSLMRQFPLNKILDMGLTKCEITDELVSLISFTTLERVYMRSMRLKHNRSISSYLKDFGTSLKEIDLSFNFINFKIQNQFIYKSKELTSLILIKTGIHYLDSALNLTNYDKLTYLDLSFNFLQVIKSYHFEFNFELKYLYLSNCNIDTIEDYSFEFLRNLVVLDLSFNNLESIYQGMFGENFELYNLKQLILNDNLLKSIEIYLISSFEKIDLQNNQLDDIPYSIKSSVQVISDFDMSGNPLVNVIGEYFFVTNHVTNLSLSKCSLTFIEEYAFYNLKIVSFLDLSINNLSVIENTSFNQLHFLQKLNLSSNKIEYIPRELFKDNPMLDKLDLSNNLIKKFEYSSFMSLFYLRILYFHRNPITDFFPTQNLSDFTRLKELFFPRSVCLNSQIVKSIESQLTVRIVRKMPSFMPSYYDSIDLVNIFESDSSSYTHEYCNFILYFIRNRIHFNLRNEFYVSKFLSECSKWGGLIFGHKLDNELRQFFLSI